MPLKNLNRKEFIRLSTLAGLGFYLPCCLASDEKEDEGATQDSASRKDTVNEAAELLQSDHVVFLKKKDSEFEKYRTGFNKRIQKYPLIIALCKNTEGVSAAVKYAARENLPVSVKSGGHSFEGFSSNNGGLVIDLSLMNEIELTEENKLKAAPGCTLSQLYDFLLPKKRILPAGSCGGVGLGGLTLGGGYGFFSRKYGLTCDNLTEITMVDGKGKIHNSKEDNELLWACKGGGNGNFGVITEMKFNTHPAPDGFTSHRFKAYKLTPERAENLLEKWFEYAVSLPPACFSAFVLNGKTLTLLITDYENGSDELRLMLNEFESLTDKTTRGTKKDLAKSLRYYYGIHHPIPFKNASAGLYNSFEDIKDCIREVIRTVGSTPGLICQVNTLGGNIQNPAFEKESVYPHRSCLFLAELQAYWEKPEREDQLLQAFQSIQETFKNNGITAHYRNYPDINFENWETAYFGTENYKRLQKVKQKYDPDDLIQHEQSVRLT